MKAARTIAAMVLSLGLLVAGCGDDEQVEAGDATTTTHGGAIGTAPAGPPDITGEITSVTPFVPITEDCTPPEDLDPDGAVSSDDPPVCTPADNDVVGTVLVEEEPGLQSGNKISFTVTTSTVLTGVAAFADLADGQRVDAWSTGMCAESYPLQCSAVAINRLT